MFNHFRLYYLCEPLKILHCQNQYYRMKKFLMKEKFYEHPLSSALTLTLTTNSAPSLWKKNVYLCPEFVRPCQENVQNSNIPVVQVFWDLPTISAVAGYTPAVTASFSVDLYEIQQAIFKVKISVRIFFRKVKRSDFVQSLSMFNF